MTIRLIQHAELLLTMDSARRELRDGALVIEDNQIVWVGQSSDLPPTFTAQATERINARGKLVMPGMVNTHHHFYQTLTRAIPAAQDAVLFDWLKTLYPIWAELTPDDVRISTQTALTELLLSRIGGGPLSWCARQHEFGRKPRGLATGSGDGRRSGDPARLPAGG